MRRVAQLLLALAVAMPQSQDPAPPVTLGYLEFPPQRGLQKVLVLRVVDGDTIDVALLLPLRIRVSNVNAPEMSTAEGKKVREAVKARLPENSHMVVILKGHDKYGRTLGNFWLDADEMWLDAWLVKNGHAVPYDGGARDR
jgi:endonuclease YncB( thermonuclease family)